MSKNQLEPQRWACASSPQRWYVITTAPALCCKGFIGCIGVIPPGSAAMRGLDYYNSGGKLTCVACLHAGYKGFLASAPKEWSAAENIDLNWKSAFNILLTSFGVKQGPLEPAPDVVVDVRKIMRNPFRNPKLKKFNGQHPAVIAYILRCETTTKHLDRLFKQHQLTPSIGLMCYGGQHRSVVAAEYLKKKFETDGFNVSVVHRDLKEGKHVK